METKVVLDTTVLIDAGRNTNNNIQSKMQILSQNYELCTTGINVFEFYHGAYLSHKADKNIPIVKGILQTLKILNTDIESMEIAGKIMAELDKKGQKMGFRDVLIAGICLTHACPIITSNKKDFERLGVKIIEI